MNTKSGGMARVAIAACVLLAASTATMAADAPDRGMDAREPVQLTFRYDPRDLSTPRGASRVYSRLLQAARRQCGIADAQMRDLRATDPRCVAELVDGVVVKSGSEELAALHRSMPRGGLAAVR
ncbi:MAG: UrcA family protein [Pseudomonadota bacterium]|jgi:UrcA family protein|nr:MAG: hypothetical protein DIU62_04830 [Pseudomonadota bacterium]